MKALCQTFSVLIGLLCCGMLFFGIIPLLGWTLWITLSLCVLGVLFGSVPDRKIGLTINVAVGVVAILRLLLGGGVV